jgi:uncharacterized membrane protein (UPF0136 family)
VKCQDDALNREGLFAEYSAIRAEILQLNGQVFATFTGALALNATVLGWMFSKDEPSNFLYLATVGAVLIFAGQIILLHRNRLAHRLAIFQKLFIESRVPSIVWARTYFEYRVIYDKTKSRFSAKWSERIAESGSSLLSLVQCTNLFIILIYTTLPSLLRRDSTFQHKEGLIYAAVVVSILLLQYFAVRYMTDYKAIEHALQRVAENAITLPDQSLQRTR